MKKLLTLVITIAMVAVLCCCGGGNTSAQQDTPAAETASEEEKKDEAAEPENKEEAEPAQEAAQEPAAEDNAASETPAPEQPTQAEEIAEEYGVADLPVAGDYNIFAVKYEGYTVSADEMEISSSLILSEDGTGSMSMAEESMGLTWSEEDGALTIIFEDESTTPGAVRGGVAEIDIYGTGDMILIYAQDGADTSSYEIITIAEAKEKMEAAEEAVNTRLGAILNDLDIESGIHLRYQLRLDALNAVQEYDVHGKDGVYYSERTTNIGSISETTVTFIKDGKVYNLYPDKKTGSYITDLPLSVSGENIMLMDSLYSEMRLASTRTDGTEEEREAEGATYSADVYPQTEYQPEIVFFFTEDDQLAFCSKGAPVIEGASEIGESFYTVEAIDGEVDESLFDISMYSIEE